MPTGTGLDALVLPDTLAARVSPVDDILKATASDGTERVTEPLTVENVIWESEPLYAAQTQGIYTFTAVLPDSYETADGVSITYKG